MAGQEGIGRRPGGSGTRPANENGRLRLPNGEFVDYALEGTDHIVTVLAEFDDPVRGQIAEPDRTQDNSTYWVPKFDREHFHDMLFAPGGGSYGHNSMRDNYLEMSSGRYTVEGQVSKWVHIDAPESEFGANGPSGDGSDNLNGPVSTAWSGPACRPPAASTRASTGRRARSTPRTATTVTATATSMRPTATSTTSSWCTPARAKRRAAARRVATPSGATAGTPDSGVGTTGPKDCLLGGYRVPGTKLWVGDYTTEPENGASGVFTHEYGHDLGLPDQYDTAGANDNRRTSGR